MRHLILQQALGTRSVFVRHALLRMRGGAGGGARALGYRESRAAEAVDSAARAMDEDQCELVTTPDHQTHGPSLATVTPDHQTPGPSLATGKMKQDVIISDSTGTTRLTL